MKNFSIAIAFLASSCMIVSRPVPPAPMPAAVPAVSPCNAGQQILNATLWMETSAEYRASTTQTYATARRMLDAALADSTWTALPATAGAAGLPPAIILDLDETAIDNLTFESRVIRDAKAYDAGAWNRWVSESAALAIPGAAEFLAYARSRGVTPFYVTNRDADQEAATRANLEKLGYPLSATEDTLLLRGERPEWKSSDKTPRRDFVASAHRVLMLFGDDLNDFTLAAGKTRAERDAIVNAHASDWGRVWFILPNPIYGSWERAATGDTRGLSDCQQLQRKVESLRP